MENHETDADARYREKVLRTFMPGGVCEALPAQMKKRLIVYEEILNLFEDGETYPEKRVNETIARVHADYCSVRRAFIGLGWMRRAGGQYTVTRPADMQSAPDAEL